MSEVSLRHFERKLTLDERAAALDGVPQPDIEPRTPAGETYKVALLDQLMAEFVERRSRGDWALRSDSDRWLAPRVHFALRIPRSVAASREVWEWLAVRYSSYVEWRWAEGGVVTEDRWSGAVNKQALARLWWGSELFRDGGSYAPVVRAFVRQDLINSYLHRPLVRCRSLALGIVDVLVPANSQDTRSADEVNDLARVLNFATAGSPPELETAFQKDDERAFAQWVEAAPPHSVDWDELPVGPPCADTTPDSLEGGRGIAWRGWDYAATRPSRVRRDNGARATRDGR